VAIGSPLEPVVADFAALAEALGLDSVEACALLYVPLPELGPIPTLGDLSPWQEILVP